MRVVCATVLVGVCVCVCVNAILRRMCACVVSLCVRVCAYVWRAGRYAYACTFSRCVHTRVRMSDLCVRMCSSGICVCACVAQVCA
jgi:hypothetical protein